MKRLITLLLFLSVLPIQAADLYIRDRGAYLTLARGVSWAGTGINSFNNTYLFTPLNPDQGICVFVRNNNPTNAHTFALAVYQTGDSSVMSYALDSGKFIQDTVQGAVSPTPAASTTCVYVHANAAARVALVFTGGGALAGTPDTADIFLVQTNHTSCGPVGNGADYVQGTVADGAAAGTQLPVTVSGVDGAGNVRHILTEITGSPMVVGTVPDGNAAGTQKPVTISGVDGAGNVQRILVQSDGAINRWTSNAASLGALTGVSSTSSYDNALLYPAEHTVQFSVTGPPTTCTCQLEGSLNNSAWFAISGDENCVAANMFHVVNRVVRYVRANISVHTGTGTITFLYASSR